MINWTNLTEQVTPNFTVKDCLWLAHWGRLANENDGLDYDIQSSIVATCMLAEKIRTILNCPMIVTSLYRPPSYSPLVGGTAQDVHTKGIAIDFTTLPRMEIEDAKDIIRPFLTPLNIRMEANTTDWIHLDSAPVGPSGREFNP